MRLGSAPRNTNPALSDRSHAAGHAPRASTPHRPQAPGIPFPCASAVRGIQVTGTYRQGDGVPQPSPDMILPREFRSPVDATGGDTKTGPIIKFSNGKPERFALAFRSNSVCTLARQSRENSASSLVRVSDSRSLSHGQELGWTIGGNVRIDYRWGEPNIDNARDYAAELAALPPDVVLSNGNAGSAGVTQAGRSAEQLIVSPVSSRRRPQESRK
jgi:hypothetical protein